MAPGKIETCNDQNNDCAGGDDNGKVCPKEDPLTCDMSVANLATGSLIHDQALFNGLSLHYNSYGTYSSAISPRWRLSTDISLEALTDGSGKIVLTEENGETLAFTPYGGGYLAERGDILDLQENGGGWTVTEPDGAFTNFSSNGRLLSITERDGRTVTLAYSGGLLSTITDSKAIAPATIEYVDGIVDIITDPYGNEYEFNYHPDGNLKEILYPLPQTISGLQAPDSDGNLQSFTYPDTGAATPKWSYTYDNGLLETKTNLSGLTTTYVFNGGKIESAEIATEYGARSKSISYDPDYSTELGESIKTDRDGGEWKYRYKKNNGRLMEKEDPEGVITYYAYTASSKSVTHPGGKRKTTTLYDDDRNVISQVESEMDGETVLSSYATTYTYNGYGQVETMTEPLDGTGESGTSKTTVYDYDGEGRITSVYDGYTSTVFYRYSTVGTNLHTFMTGPLGQVTETIYDDNDRITSVTLPGNVTTGYFYDANGNLDYTDGPLAGDVDRTDYKYDSLGQFVQMIAPGNIRTTYTYYPDGSMKKVIDPEGKVTEYNYTNRGQQDEVKDAAGNVTEMAYGDGGCATCGGVDKLTALTDANGKVTRFVYDELGRQKAELFLNATTVKYNYIDRYTYTKTGARGIVITYENDFMERLVKKKADGNVVEEYSYYDNGWLETAAKGGLTYTYTYYPDGRVKTVNDGTRTITYIYDAAGNRTSRTVSGLSDLDVTYTYTAAGQPDTIVSAAGTFDYDYEIDGRRDTLTYPAANGVVTDYQYDTAGRLTGIVSTKGAATITSSNYTHTPSGNRATHTKYDGTETIGVSYTYDDVYRLKTATHVRTGGTDEGPQFEHYSTDAIGNRLAMENDLLNNYYPGYEIPEGSDPDYTYYRDETDSFWTPDTLDRGTASFDYDYENRLTKVTRVVDSVTTVVDYEYDVFGRRVGRTVTVGGVQTVDMEYIYDNEDIIAVYEDGNLEKVFIHGPGIDEPLAVKSGSDTYYYHADGLGSVMVVTDSGGAPVGSSFGYDSFGNLVKGSLDETYSYTGREWDKDAGLYYYRARFYDPLIGKFISKDPIGFAGGDYNLYSYVQQNPVNWSDPMGLDRNNPCKGLTGFALWYCKKYTNLVCSLKFVGSIACCEFEKGECDAKATANCDDECDLQKELSKCKKDWEQCRMKVKK